MEGESFKKEIASNISNNTLTNPSPRDLPIVIISAWQPYYLDSPQTVTFNSFLANYNNANRPGGGDGVLDLDSGVFTCFTPGYYTVSFSAYGRAISTSGYQELALYKNGTELPESRWQLARNSGALGQDLAMVGSRIVVSNFLDMFARKLSHVEILQILHMDAGDTLELRMTQGNYINYITLNIELIGFGFD